MIDSTATPPALPAPEETKAGSAFRPSRREPIRCESRARPGLSQRQQAKHLGISRGRWRHWQQRRQAIAAPAAEVAFFESPEGLTVLQRTLAAAHLVITELSAGGIRQVITFLNLSGLSRHVGSSYGCQQAYNVRIEQALVEYGRQQRERLRVEMPAREITVGEDETYHPQPCLVGLEPVSGFILLERYAQDRSAQTWDRVLHEATEGLPVKVIQVTSDQARGLLRHAANQGAQASPDLFHCQHDLVKATGLALRRAEQQAASHLAETEAALAEARQAAAEYRAQAPRRGRPNQREVRREQVAEVRHLAAQVEQEQAQQRRRQAQEIIREVGTVYHPYDLTTGAARTPDSLQAELTSCTTRLERLARAAQVPERPLQLLNKAKGLLPALLLTLHFFIRTCRLKVAALNLPSELALLLQQNLIPAIYLDRVVQRSPTAEDRRRLRQLATELLRPLGTADSPFAALSEAERHRVEGVARECADLFQRSSSAVEGRNGQLSLHHHGQHRLSDRKLAAKTTLHNYFIRRADGTTAAQRFFGRPPEDLFPWILSRLTPLPRPAKKRPKPPKPMYLQSVAA